MPTNLIETCFPTGMKRMLLVNNSFRFLATIAVASSLALAGCASSGSSSSQSEASVNKNSNAQKRVAAVNQRPSEIDVPVTGKVTRTGEVYLLRGLANVFSRGMDTMGARLVKSGVDARVYNHSAWKSLANNIIARAKVKRVSYPVIILGHSLGANASAHMAKYLGDSGVKVRYVVAFDPTVPTKVGKNIRQVTNYYLPNDDHNNLIYKESGFKGTLKNVNVSNMAGVTHMNVEKNHRLQGKTIQHIISLTKKRKSKKS